MNETKPIKPLGRPAYGSIPHLPGSRRGPADKGLSEQQAKLLTEKTRDKYDIVIVQEKLDGSNVSVAKINGALVPLIRAGYPAISSHYAQHHAFHDWVISNRDRFDELLGDGERVVGEWLMEAHGTRYNLHHEPFVAFDIMNGSGRIQVSKMLVRCRDLFVMPRIISFGPAASIKEIVSLLDPSGHGAIDPVEGAVWRMERKGVVDFLGKYVRPEKVDGQYLNGVGGIERDPIYNWKP